MGELRVREWRMGLSGRSREWREVIENRIVSGGAISAII